MERVLFLSHTEQDGSLSKISLEALSAAKKITSLLNTEFVIGLWGEKIDGAAAQVANSIPHKIIAVNGEEYKNSRYYTDTLACETICKSAEAHYIISAASSRVARVIAGVATRMKGLVDTHANEFNCNNGLLEATRWFYKQRMHSSVKRTKRPWFITVDPGTFFPWETSHQKPSNISFITPTIEQDKLKTEYDRIKEPNQGEQTIKPDASLLFVAGAGWTKKQASGKTEFERAGQLILDFLRKSNASLGGSKSVVDMNGEGEAPLPFMTHLNQIGQTGATPRHAKGLAACCHGEEPHVVGWRFINERRAINLDSNCGWAHGKADVLYIADAFQVVEELNKLLK